MGVTGFVFELVTVKQKLRVLVADYIIALVLRIVSRKR